MTKLTYSDAKRCRLRCCPFDAIERVPVPHGDKDRIDHLRFCGPHADLMRSRLRELGYR